MSDNSDSSQTVKLADVAKLRDMLAEESDSIREPRQRYYDDGSIRPFDEYDICTIAKKQIYKDISDMISKVFNIG